MKNIDLVVIGAGPAGLAAAIEARKQGVKDILVLEREREPGGILQQCIHTGFGLHVFNEELTGPEYAGRFIEQARELGISIKLDTMVLNVNNERQITAVNTRDGLIGVKAKAVVLAMGCRERTRGALNIPGARPAGIFTAGTAQRLVNMEGYLPGKNIVILGSGDIGLIMARRMTLEGAKVKMVCEILPYPGGLTRNIVQCLYDYDIPLKLSHTIVKIHGRERLEGVTVARVDNTRNPVPGTEEYVECDTLLLSVGLIPENELSKQAGVRIDSVTGGPEVNESMETSVPGIFACGNVLHVHDLVDNVTEESRLAGMCAARYVINGGCVAAEAENVKITAGRGVRYVVPHTVRRSCLEPDSKLLFRVDGVYRNVRINVECGGRLVFSKKKQKVCPGEMESIRLSRNMIEELKNVSEMTVHIDGI